VTALVCTAPDAVCRSTSTAAGSAPARAATTASRSACADARDPATSPVSHASVPTGVPPAWRRALAFAPRTRPSSPSSMRLVAAALERGRVDIVGRRPGVVVPDR
jgi:hypothetical protein